MGFRSFARRLPVGQMTPRGRGDAVAFAGTVRLAVALAFADASIVVLALPQIVDRLHTSISHVIWVIAAYNLALAVVSVAVLLAGARLPARPALAGGLALFGAASLGCGISSSLALLIVLRCLQGAGGALVLAASLPLFESRSGASHDEGWSAAAAFGAAVGPALGGVLTELFDWRAIFIVQTPVAALAAWAALRGVNRQVAAPAPEAARPPVGGLRPGVANLALALLSAGIIGALFLVVIELINGWLLSPIAAAAVVTAIPVATLVAERFVRSRVSAITAGAGAASLAAGSILLAVLGQRELGVVILALLLCGAGLGLAFPGLTTAALARRGSASARAAATVGARDFGLMIGLVILAPVFAHQVSNIQNDKAPVARATAAVLTADLPVITKFALGSRLVDAYRSTGAADVPRVGPAFTATAAGQSPGVRRQLTALQGRIEAIVQRAVTPAFRWPYALAALFALLVLPVLALGERAVRGRTA